MSALPIAAPSWVMPGTMAENAHFLAGKVSEVGLCCFETSSSASMPEADLPASLADLPLAWHVHLPTDLPVGPGDGESAALAAMTVWNRVAFLQPRLAVLHLPPPEAGIPWLEDFLLCWRHKGLASDLIAVENIRAASPVMYREALASLGVSLCLDIGHALAYGQEDIWRDADDLSERVRLVHWSAPGEPHEPPRDRHLPLTAWTLRQRRLAEEALERIPSTAGHLVEVFAWEGVLQSWPVLASLPGWPQERDKG